MMSYCALSLGTIGFKKGAINIIEEIESSDSSIWQRRTLALFPSKSPICQAIQLLNNNIFIQKPCRYMPSYILSNQKAKVIVSKRCQQYVDMLTMGDKGVVRSSYTYIYRGKASLSIVEQLTIVVNPRFWQSRGSSSNSVRELTQSVILQQGLHLDISGHESPTLKSLHPKNAPKHGLITLTNNSIAFLFGFTDILYSP